MSDITHRISQLSPDKRAKLEVLLHAKKEARLRKKRVEQIEPHERMDGLAPLSLAQQRLWIIEQLTPDTALYTVPFVARLEGEIDQDALQKTLDAMVARHEALRTRIIIKDEEPKQEILDPTPVTLIKHDLSDFPSEQQTKKARELLDEVVKTPFVLQGDDLFRAVFIQETNKIYYLAVMMHHIVSDGWSWGIFIREFALLYQGHTQGVSANLAPLPIQFADYAIWQRSCVQQKALAKQIDYWKTTLTDVPTFLEFPTDKPRSVMPSLAGNTTSTIIDKTLANGLRRFSQDHGVSLFMTMMAGFVILMSRYSRQSDLVIGTPVSGRTRAELEGVFGFFVNTLPLRFKEIDKLTSEALLDQVREVILNGFANQDIPFDQIVELVAPERTLSHTPLVQVVFTLQTDTLQRYEHANMILSPETVSTETAKFDLMVTAVEETDGRLRLFCEYRTDLFLEATIERLLQQFIVLLSHLIADKSCLVKQLEILPKTEKDLVLQTWNDTQRAYPQTDLITLVQEQANNCPEAIAVVEGSTVVDYQTLVGKAAQIARILQDAGVKRSDRVGIYLDRGVGLVEILLGTLMAGAAYVPLDVTYPPNRLKLMAEDAQLSLIISHTSEEGWLFDLNLPILSYDTMQQRQDVYETTSLDLTLTPDDLAYIIYTSGSTGIPKGVAVSHRAIIRLVFGTQYTQFDATRIFLLLAPVSFDASTLELWGALLHGAKCIIYPERVPNLVDLQQIISRQKITTLWLTASLFNLIIDEAPNILAPVQEILTGGEALSPKHIWQAQQQLPQTQFINGYGPTETTTFACCYRIPQLSAPIPSSIFIGHAIGNTTTYILDEYLQPSPIGVPGELYIGGDGLAWGYWDKPAFTAERFVPDPFSTKPGSRLYRTGDLVRWDATGQIEFLGRIDQQIKLHGFRIELGEIETAVLQHASVRNTAVIVREDQHGERRLVAYVVAMPEEQIVPDLLLAQLKQDLPTYMLPSAIVTLDQLPMTNNGKLDHGKLPNPVVETSTTENEEQPLNAIETILQQIWCDTLGSMVNGRDDNFFALGGDSILAIQVVSRANQAGLPISTRQLFQYQTIGELANAIQHTENSPAVIEARQEPVSGIVGILPIVSWFQELSLANPSYFNQSLLLHSQEQLSQAALQEAVSALIVHHDSLRLRLKQTNGNYQLSIDADLQAPPVELIMGNSHRRTVTEIVSAGHQKINMATGPLVYIAIIRDVEHEVDKLLFICHHLAVDGLSWRILLEDLEVAYRQRLENKEIVLPRKTTDLISWQSALQKYLSSSQFGEAFRYWQRFVDIHMPPLLTDKQDGPNTMDAVASMIIEFSVDETQALVVELPNLLNCRVHELLIAILGLVVHQWTQENLVLLALESHGRENLPDVDLSRTVGWFTSLYPVVLTIPDKPVVAAIQDILAQLNQIPALGLSYGLGRYLGDSDKQAALKTIPEPQISFNYLGQFRQGAIGTSLFSPTDDDTNLDQSPNNKRPFLIDIVSSVLGDRLFLNCLYSKHIHLPETIQQIADQFEHSCRQLIVQSKQAEISTTVSLQENLASLPFASHSSFLIPLKRTGSLPPFFCVHPSGGTVFRYRALAQHMHKEQSFYGLQAPGFEHGEEPFTDLVAMARAYINAIQQIDPVGPYYLGGWSLGGVVAYEMACQLQAKGYQVNLLCIIDVDPDLSPYQIKQAKKLLRLTKEIQTVDNLLPLQIKQLRLSEQVDFLTNTEYQDRGQVVDAERFLTYLKVLSAHAKARLAYQMKTYNQKMAVFRARNQSVLEQAKYAPWQIFMHNTIFKSPKVENAIAQWRTYCTNTIDFYEVPGDHMSIMNEPYVLTLAEKLQNALFSSYSELTQGGANVIRKD